MCLYEIIGRSAPVWPVNKFEAGVTMSDLGVEDKVWFVMRSIFKTEMTTKAKLDEAGIRSFIPMGYRVKIINGRKSKIQTPIIRNLLFVYSDSKTLAPFLAADSKFQYTYRRGGRENEPLIVPDNQMRQFIDAVEISGQPLFFTPEELNIAKGTKIRIIGGPFDGFVGVLMKVKGARAKRLVIEIPDAVAVAVDVNPDMIEVLPE